MTKIVLLDRDTYADSVDLIHPDIDHEWVEYGNTPADKIVERVVDADVVITNKVPMRAETLAAAKNLKMISVSATGYDVIDIPACQNHNITVSNVRGYATNTVPEHTFALIFALRRGLIGYRQDVIDGKWQESGQFCFHTHSMKDLNGATLGIIGEGSLGQSVANIARGFGMRPIFAAHKGVDGLGPLYTDFDQVLEESDIITLHCPLMESTRNVLSTAEFKKMKKQPLIINTARGGLVDEEAITQALEQGLIGGLGFDVLTKEPPAPDQPLLRIMNRPNVIVTPHVAWASQEAMQTCWNQTITHINNFYAGNPTNTLT